jgi:hypothetical protein
VPFIYLRPRRRALPGTKIRGGSSKELTGQDTSRIQKKE